MNIQGVFFQLPVFEHFSCWKPLPMEAPPANVAAILSRLETAVPSPVCELLYQDPFQLLVSTVLSAQCTDRMVNRITPEVFRRWPDAKALSQAASTDLESVIRPTGLYRTKARHLIDLAAVIVNRHDGQVPTTMERLLALPGVARKTANVVLGTGFGIPAGIVVDTHVLRVTRRWGWHAERAPEQAERRLMVLVPEDRWTDFGHRVVLFGRYTCKARNPECSACPMAPVCPSVVS